MIPFTPDIKRVFSFIFCMTVYVKLTIFKILFNGLER